ncbi:MAG: cytochrome c oxidase subunit 3 [Spirochaetia bacterium]|nr:cytochrome c oxidase subunit 3 [Spirochaetia bacterium]
MSDVTIERVPKGRLGVWLLIAGEIVIFGGFIASYILARLEYPEFGSKEAAGDLNIVVGTVNTLILLISNWTMVKAHEAALEKNVAKAKSFMIYTLVLGLLFLGIKLGYEWPTDFSHGHTISSSKAIADQAPGSEVMKVSLFWSYYFLMTGFHGLHIVVGSLVIFFVMLGISGGQNLHRVELAGAYWHLVELVWVILFPMLYLIQ